MPPVIPVTITSLFLSALATRGTKGGENMKAAKQFREIFNTPKHLVLEASHPSPFSAYQGFMGCKHFSKCNNFLRKNYGKIIDWSTKEL